MIFRLA
jgi:hypothetical protein